MTAQMPTQDGLYREAAETYGAALERLARAYEADPDVAARSAARHPHRFVAQLRGLQRTLLAAHVDLSRLPAATLHGKIPELLELFSLAGDRNTPISSYSNGMRQKILICAA